MGICIRLWNANSIQIHLVQFQAIPLSFALLTTLVKIVDIMCNIYGCISCVCVFWMHDIGWGVSVVDVYTMGVSEDR